MSSAALPHTILIHFSGPDKPGLTAELTGAIAGYDIRILDIGQAVVHETLSLGILLEVLDESNWATLRAALHDRAHALGLLARFTIVQPDAIQHWIHGLHHQHFIITALGRSITAVQLARVSRVIAAHGMNIDRIDRLSAELSPQDAGANACVELAVSGDPSREAHMRAEFLASRRNSRSTSPSSAKAFSGATAGFSHSTWIPR